jgi:hypothetical protein
LVCQGFEWSGSWRAGFDAAVVRWQNGASRSADVGFDHPRTRSWAN